MTSTVLESIANGAFRRDFPWSEAGLLLKPRGFCAGVVRAIDIVKIALETFGAPIYVRREIVHNRYVVNELAEKGAIFVHEIDDVPDGQRVIYSAHGVSPAVRERSKGRGLKVIDATCPLVTKVHIEAVKFAKQGYSLVLIGHRDHDEIEGTLGEAPDVTQVVSSAQEVETLQVPDPDRVAYLTQTTLSLDEARDIIHALKDEVSRTSSGRIRRTSAMPRRTARWRCAMWRTMPDLVLVVGSTNSSNSNRLVEVSRNLGTMGYLIDNSQAIDPAWLEGVDTVAVTAGASAPEILVEDVVNYLRQNGFASVEEVEVMPENVRFGLPPEIVQAIGGAGGDEAVPFGDEQSVRFCPVIRRKPDVALNIRSCGFSSSSFGGRPELMLSRRSCGRGTFGEGTEAFADRMKLRQETVATPRAPQIRAAGCGSGGC